MKLLLLSFALTTLTCAFASERQTLNDLESMKLRVEERILKADINYPNYRMGGGTGPTRKINDCLLLDILDSDNLPTEAQKLEIANELNVADGFSEGFKVPLTPSVKGNNIVFELAGRLKYVTTITVATHTGEPLKRLLDRIMPPTRHGNAPAAVNLLYVRDCRF